RTYPIRVQSPTDGSSGPMSRELTLTEIARRSGISLRDLQRTETTSTTGRQRRIGEFDWALLRKSASLNGPSDIALASVDYLSIANRGARRFDKLTDRTIRFIEPIEEVTGAPLSLTSTRYHQQSIIDRRLW